MATMWITDIPELTVLVWQQWTFHLNRGVTSWCVVRLRFCGGALDLFTNGCHQSWSKYQLLPPYGSSDHPALSILLDIRQRVAEFTIRREVILKFHADWDAIANDLSSLPWRDIR